MLSNWTKATTTTTGTGTLTLVAVTGRPLPSASRAVGEFVQYSIVTSDSKYESGIGTIGASETLGRTKVFSTYDGTTYNSTTATALSLAAGTHTVYITTLAEAVFEPLHFPLTGPTNANIFSTGFQTTHANVSIAAASRAIAYPFCLETSGVLTSMSCSVGVGGAGSTTLLGLYDVLSTGRPGRRIAKTSTTIDTSTTGWKSQAVDVNARLTPGWYWAALCVTAGSLPQFTGAVYSASPFGAAGNVVLTNIRSDTTATDLADPFLTTSLVYTSTSGVQNPFIGLILS